MDENKVDMAILLQGSYYGFQNEYVTEIVKKYPNRFRGAGVFDPFCRYADKIFERLRNELKFRIWKIESSSVNGLLGYHRSYRIDQVFAPYLSVIASDGGTVAFDIGDLEMDSYQIEAMRSIAQS